MLKRYVFNVSNLFTYPELSFCELKWKRICPFDYNMITQLAKNLILANFDKRFTKVVLTQIRWFNLEKTQFVYKRA